MNVCPHHNLELVDDSCHACFYEHALGTHWGGRFYPQCVWCFGAVHGNVILEALNAPKLLFDAPKLQLV
jgi:hypothetical protein